MAEELARVRLLATQDDFHIALGGSYDDEVAWLDEHSDGAKALHGFYDVLGEDELTGYTARGFKIFAYDEERHRPGVMVFDGKRWIDDGEVSSSEMTGGMDVATANGLDAALDLVQSEIEAIALATIELAGDAPAAMAIDATAPKGPLEGLREKIARARAALEGAGTVQDLRDAAREIRGG